jgi:NAD(P)-dependent dehydrogenase (short-subunit alcohol dehydrogenase family)
MSTLKNKVALVTGAGQAGNIGAALCDAYLREEAGGVMATRINEAYSADLLYDLHQRYGEECIQFTQLDVSAPEQRTAALDATVRHFGHLDVLVNKAGIASHGRIANSSPDDLRKVVAVNHDGSLLGIKACRCWPMHRRATQVAA